MANTKKKVKSFSRLTKNEKVIIILKDAIAQLKAKKYKATCGTYTEVDLSEYEIQDYYSTKIEKESCNIQLQKILPTVKNCPACAKGSIFLSLIGKNNHLTLEQYKDMEGDWDSMKDRLESIFDINQLDLIETAFEKRVVETDNEYLAIDNELETHSIETYEGRDFIRRNKEKLTEVCIKAIRFGMKYKNDNNRLIAILENTVKHRGIFKP